MQCCTLELSGLGNDGNRCLMFSYPEFSIFSATSQHERDDQRGRWDLQLFKAVAVKFCIKSFLVCLHVPHNKLVTLICTYWALIEHWFWAILKNWFQSVNPLLIRDWFIPYKNQYFGFLLMSWLTRYLPDSWHSSLESQTGWVLARNSGACIWPWRHIQTFFSCLHHCTMSKVRENYTTTTVIYNYS